MIVEPLSSFVKYLSIHPLFPKAYDFLCLVQQQGFPEGHFLLDGQRLIATIVTGENELETPLESHRKYITIQYVISGIDRIGWRPVSTCLDIALEYSPEQDRISYSDMPTTQIDVQPDCLAIFFPHDAHSPLFGNGPVKKIILKVAVEATL